MALSEEQIEEVKKQISEQIKHLPEDQRKEWNDKIDSMSPEELENFVKEQMSQQQAGQKIFRAIVDQEIPSKIIEDVPECIAVLDIKPISRGHTIIIPKAPAEKTNDLPDSSFMLAKKVSSRIIEKLKAEGTEIQTQFTFGEMIINIIPIYDKPLSINSPRTDAIPEDLQKLYEILVIKKELEKINLDESNNEEAEEKVIILDRKIP